MQTNRPTIHLCGTVENWFGKRPFPLSAENQVQTCSPIGNDFLRNRRKVFTFHAFFTVKWLHKHALNDLIFSSAPLDFPNSSLDVKKKGFTSKQAHMITAISWTVQIDINLPY